MDLKDPDMEDFATAAYLALKVRESHKTGRSPDDALKFGIGKYHGAFAMLSKAQKKTGDKTNFSPVAEVLQSGASVQGDLLNYINEVFYSGESYQRNRPKKSGDMCSL